MRVPAELPDELANPLHLDTRLLEALVQLLRITAPELRSALTQACNLIARALQADKVDVFLYEAATDSLVALGISETPMGQRQRELGLDRFPLANAGPLAEVFESGQTYLTDHAELDPTQPRGVVERLGVRSQLDCAVEVESERRGVLGVAASRENAFDERDRRFLEVVAGWVGLVTHRAELAEQVRSEAVLSGRLEAAAELARLTRREQEVACCIAEGLSNDEIAERLVLASGTVANHIEHILDKLHFRSRTQIAVWAVEHGLYRTDRGQGRAGN
jgi:DNA-binding CsgD family transcriptional regulator